MRMNRYDYFWMLVVLIPPLLYPMNFWIYIAAASTARFCAILSLWTDYKWYRRRWPNGG